MRKKHVVRSEDKIYFTNAKTGCCLTIPKEICSDMRKGDEFEIILDGRCIIFIPASNRPRAYRKIFKHATRIFGSKSAAAIWLHTPQLGLGGEIPVDVMRAKRDEDDVEMLLVQIEYGLPL